MACATNISNWLWKTGTSNPRSNIIGSSSRDKTDGCRLKIAFSPYQYLRQTARMIPLLMKPK
jgi:hypothetical protein